MSNLQPEVFTDASWDFSLFFPPFTFLLTDLFIRHSNIIKLDFIHGTIKAPDERFEAYENAQEIY
jgi:hypothetical protein